MHQSKELLTTVFSDLRQCNTHNVSNNDSKNPSNSCTLLGARDTDSDLVQGCVKSSAWEGTR